MGRIEPAFQQAPKALVLALVKAYQWGFSPFCAPTCRYLPTCSDYAFQCFTTQPFWVASRLTLKRLCRCHPWGGSGFDPVPGPHPKLPNQKDT